MLDLCALLQRSASSSDTLENEGICLPQVTAELSAMIGVLFSTTCTVEV